ncbi:MAG: TIGR03087 family PEP-CTERM/XrtA system glycosyltransferase [Alphaproteobacteria bacterium]|jgi:sugar transferase (PEP-CTERM/EpsH1 system associated)|nr:TIGR03087 family PEP-CTERM/XrtA system glycosyltransferase [Alphaproteobacteria bacterium]MBP9876802.1 TIGR03087 family PEP-CTERM/XrtA system glycosyltransferase [Alphaproteobacteria bacterium]
MEKEHLLFLVHRIPYPPNKGDKIRSWHILQNLSEVYHVHVGGFIDHEPDWVYVPTIAAITKSHCFLPLKPLQAKIRSLKALITGKSLTEYYFFDERLAEWVEEMRTMHHIKKVFVFSSGMASYIMNEGWIDAIKVMDFVDVDSDKWAQYAMQKSFPLSWIYRREGRKLQSFEKKIAQFCTASLFVSEKERNFFLSQNPDLKMKTVKAVMNGVDLSFWDWELSFPSPYPEGKEVIVFSGAMDYWPNIDAVTWFCQDVMPMLRNVLPNVLFAIVGSNPSPDVKALVNEGNILVTGSVTDIRPYISHAKVSVAPMRVSRGIQNKVLEAMVMGKPVIATHLALSALEDLSCEAMTADEPAKFRDSVLKLLNDGAQQEKIGKKARLFIQKNYSWDLSHRVIRALFENK